jgi:regulator of protease activity HflC (stomatin/prohibitin superfamily)
MERNSGVARVVRAVIGNLFLLIVAGVLVSCAMQVTEIEAGHEGVVVQKPLIFGSSGVMPEAASTGRIWHWWTTLVVPYNIQPFRVDEQFADLITSDNVPVTFNSYVQMQVTAGKTPLLHEKFGPEWYANNVQESYRTMVRDFARGHKVFDLTTDAGITSQGEILIAEQLRKFCAAKGLPIEVQSVVIGSVTPPAEVLAETARTAAQEQRAKTEKARADAELSRKQAEENKAIADKAYAERFGMNNEQFLHYRSLEIQREMIEVVKDKENVHVVVSPGGAVPTFKVGD